jgi:hypothetical protein
MGGPATPNPEMTDDPSQGGVLLIVVVASAPGAVASEIAATPHSVLTKLRSPPRPFMEVPLSRCAPALPKRSRRRNRADAQSRDAVQIKVVLEV